MGHDFPSNLVASCRRREGGGQNQLCGGLLPDAISSQGASAGSSLLNKNFQTMHDYFCSLSYVKSSWVFPFSGKIAIKSGIIHFFAENFLLKCNGGSRLRNFWPKFSGMTLVATLLYWRNLSNFLVCCLQAILQSTILQQLNLKNNIAILLLKVA